MKGSGSYNQSHIHKNHSLSDSNGDKHWAVANGKLSSSLFPARFLIPLLVFFSFVYFLYILSLFISSSSCPPKPITTSNSSPF